MPSPAVGAPHPAPEPSAVAASKCRRRTIPTGAARPSDMLAAFFSAGLAMLALGGACAIADAAGGDWRLHWLALHLALLGGVSQLVLGAAQFFVCAFLATTPPSRRMVAAQIAVWNTGTVLVAIGVTATSPRLAEAGGAVLALGLGLYIAQMGTMQRRSLQSARWAVRWYEASAACLVAGILVGVLLAGGVTWTHGSLLGAHLALNIAGWMGTAIVGTLHTFFPSLTGTQLRFPRLQGPTFAAWLAGVALLALGAAFGSDPVVAAGWLGALAAAALLVANVAGSLRARTIELSLPARLVALAQAFLLAGLALGLAATLADGASGPLSPDLRPALSILLLGGWVGLTVGGSLLHLLAVLGRVRHFTRGLPAPHPARDRAVTLLAGLAVASWAAAQAPGMTFASGPATALRVAAVVVIAGRIAWLAVRAMRPAPAGRAGAA
ncbi:MAG: hypothetical protein U0T02_05155 [Solirubrobacteraceae bacterium]